jgi:hypothetical protein
MGQQKELTGDELKAFLLIVENQMDTNVEAGILVGYELERIYRDEQGVVQAIIQIDPVVSARSITINIGKGE